MFCETTSFSAVALCILGLLREQFLLSEPWDDWNVSSDNTDDFANGRHWLSNYEAVRRKWTSDAGIQNAIKADPLFSRLLKANVTFLDDLDMGTDDDEILLPAPPGPRGRRVVPRGAVRAERAARNHPYE